MHCCREVIRSSAILDSCFGHFWDGSHTNVVLLKDQLLEFRSLEQYKTPSGRRSWLRYCGEQQLKEKAIALKRLSQKHSLNITVANWKKLKTDKRV